MMRATKGVVFTSLLSIGTAASTVPLAGSNTNSNVTVNSTMGLPVVDLGYELHRALSFNSTGNYYSFTNIRYAAPPVGDLRFRKPQLPVKDTSVIQDGAVGRICPQVFPAWYSVAVPFMSDYLAGNVPLNKRQVAAIDPRTTEDCLFLDVAVPKDVFNNAHKGKGAPVLVWIHGGGYTLGEKNGVTGGEPAGLLARSNNSIVYVAMNYRLGVFGWLGGSDLKNQGDANAGLWDQRMALQWVKDHIKDFGGDANDVTIMGESAGGSSVMYQLTAFGGRKPSLFNQAILQSPGIEVTSNSQSNALLTQFLNLTGVQTLDQARQLSSEQLIAANMNQIAPARYGSFLYGPTIDGDLVPDLSSELLKLGKFDKQVKVLIGHNANEGLLFTNANSVNTSTFDPNFKAAFPSLPQTDLDYLSNTLYPAVFDGSAGYTDSVMRQAAVIADSEFLCNAYALGKYTTPSYMYEFAVFPAIHGGDLPYTFYIGSDSLTEMVTARRTKRQLPPVSIYNLAALSLQEWIVSFTKTGKPSSSHGPAFPIYDSQRSILKLVSDASGPIAAADDIVVARCEAWINRLWPNIIHA